MRILITGIHGFVGSNLVKALSDRHIIYGLDIIAPQKEGVVRTFSWDTFLDENLTVDAIIHLAAIVHDTRDTTAAEHYFRVNTGLTQRIYDWFLASPTARKFIFFSTAKVGADRVEGVLTEDVVPSPVGPYSESKFEAERYIFSHPAEGKSVYVFRPCMIHGPGNKGNLNLLYNAVAKGIPWPLGAFENLRSFTSIDNVSYAVEGVLTREVPSGVYNICDDEPLSTNELIEIIWEIGEIGTVLRSVSQGKSGRFSDPSRRADQRTVPISSSDPSRRADHRTVPISSSDPSRRADQRTVPISSAENRPNFLGRKARIWRLPRWLMNGVARVGGWLHLPLNPLRMQKLTENYVSSNAKIKRALGIERFPVEARDGIKKTIKSFQSE